MDVKIKTIRLWSIITKILLPLYTNINEKII